MKVIYWFVTGKIEVEVPEEWGLVHKEMNRLEENNNHTETRRHDSMDMLADERGIEFADAVDVGECVVSHLESEALNTTTHTTKQQYYYEQLIHFSFR